MKVDLRCTNGYVHWEHPNGGVRISFKAPMDYIGEDFTVCLLSDHGGVNIFSEDKKGLKLIRSHEINNPKKSVCVKSDNGTAIVYLEASSKNTNEVRIDYHMDIFKSGSKQRKGKICGYFFFFCLAYARILSTAVVRRGTLGAH